MAPGPARRRSDWRARIVAAAGSVPHLLRAHVHESEGCAICGCDGRPDARSGPARGGISKTLASHHPDRRTWRWPVDRLAHPRRPRAGLYAGRLCAADGGTDQRRWRAQRSQALAARRLRARARPDPRLSRDGADLAMVDHAAGQSADGPDVFLAILREALEGDVRRRTGFGARYALVLSAHAI